MNPMNTAQPVSQAEQKQKFSIQAILVPTKDDNYNEIITIKLITVLIIPQL